MARKKKPPEANGPDSAPEWMVTFSDCMTLLLTFFVLLLSFSSFDEKRLTDTTSALAQQFSVGPKNARTKTAFQKVPQIQQMLEPDDGSETPILEIEMKNRATKNIDQKDYHGRKVFFISSENIFWGNGTIISPQGRETLSYMAKFLKLEPSRVIISENQGRNATGNDHFGMQRTWAVFDYFTTKQHLDKEQFSITSTSLTTQDGIETEEDISGAKSRRKLEIILLERSIYN